MCAGVAGGVGTSLLLLGTMKLNSFNSLSRSACVNSISSHWILSIPSSCMSSSNGSSSWPLCVLECLLLGVELDRVRIRRSTYEE